MKEIIGKIIIAVLVMGIIGLIAFTWNNGGRSAVSIIVGSFIVIIGSNMLVEGVMLPKGED